MEDEVVKAIIAAVSAVVGWLLRQLTGNKNVKK